MKKFRFTLSIALALVVGLIASAGASAAQAQTQGPAISGLNAELCQRAGLDSVCLSWTPGTGDYTYQEIKYWETGGYYSSARGSRVVLPDVSETHIPIMYLNRSGNHDGDVSYTFQGVGVTGNYGNFDYAGYSNQVTLVIPAHLMELDNDESKKGKAPAAKPGK